MKIESCPHCTKDVEHHSGTFVQCGHCGYVLKSPMKSLPRERPISARDRHNREDRVRFADRDYSGDPPELNFS